jgi:uncharacterized DUF497 family protein
MFEWDEDKRLSNIDRHGIDFIDAPLIWQNPMLVHQDVRKDYGETRWIALGRLLETIVLVVYTERAGNIRLISIRRANKHERKIYEETFGPLC